MSFGGFIRGASAALILAASVASAGCSIRGYAVNSLGDALASAGSGFASDDDPELIRAAAPFSLKLMETVLADAPEHGPLLAAAARGFAQYSYAFVQEEADERQARDVGDARALRQRSLALYRRALDYGLRSLEIRHRGLRARLAVDPRAALARLDAGDAEALYWSTVAWASSIALAKDSPDALVDLRIVDAMVERLRALGEDFDSGALHSFLVSYEMARPGAANPEPLARRHFEAAVRLSAGQRAAPFVAFAESVCVARQDRAQFARLLRRALAIDVDARPQWRLENRVMQRRARWLLTQADELFLE